MSLFEKDDFRWRETYFVLFDEQNRPNLDKLQQVLQDLNSRFRFDEANCDEDGRIESLILISPDDYAALEIGYSYGEEVREQVETLAAELSESIVDAAEQHKLDQLRQTDARFDVMHFEQVADSPLEGDDEMLDPSALLVVLDALTELTSGVCVDPQSGTLM